MAELIIQFDIHSIKNIPLLWQPLSNTQIKHCLTQELCDTAATVCATALCTGNIKNKKYVLFPFYVHQK